MKQKLLNTSVVICLTAFLFLLVACKKNLSPVTPVMETVDTSAVLKFQGSFANGPYGNVSGSAQVYFHKGVYSLFLNNVNISNGPDLHVYLSKEVMPANFINLGRIKSTNGNQVYEISGTPDFLVYKYALIHCRQYNHLFGSAELK